MFRLQLPLISLADGNCVGHLKLAEDVFIYNRIYFFMPKTWVFSIGTILLLLWGAVV